MEHKNNPQNPPQWAINFLEWFCPDELLEGLLGDLLEQYDNDQLSYSQLKSNLRFTWNVIRLFHPAILTRNKFSVNIINSSMFKNQFKVAYRNMVKAPFYSFNNILGLSLAIAFIFLTFQFIQSELNYDTFHSKHKNIYRLYTETTNTQSNTSRTSAITAVPLSNVLADESTQVKAFTRFVSSTKEIAIKGEYFEEVVHFADPGFLKMFDFKVSGIGVDENALKQPNSIYLSPEKAQKYFGDTNPVGELINLRINNEEEILTVAGIIHPEKEKSSIPFDMLVSMDLFRKDIGEETFDSFNYGIVENFILSKGNQSEKELEASFSDIIDKFISDEKSHTKVGLQALSTIHLDDHITGNSSYTGPQKLYIAGGLALIILFISVLNFITLSTSHALNRAKELGIRSTLGAKKGALKRQLINESFFITFLACAIALVFAQISLPYFKELTESRIQFDFGLNELLFIALICFIISVITGSLQSYFLLKNNIVKSLKQGVKISGKNSVFNQTLMVIQFAIATLLIVAALGIRTQMQFIQNKDLGFDDERLIEINLNSSPDLESTQQLVERFRSLAIQNKSVLAISASMNNTDLPWTKFGFEQEDGQSESINFNQIDPDYIKTMGIELVDGQNFNKDIKNTDGIIVNEALVKHFGWEQPIGKQIPGKNFEETHRVIGVVKDFHFSSLHEQIEPMILAEDVSVIRSGITGVSTFLWPVNYYQLIVRVDKGEIAPVLEFLEDTWKQIAPDKAFVFHFADDSLDKKYANERRWSKIINMATLFAIFVTCIGLLGLMQLSVQRRTKEIGIRKILGSNTSQIIRLLSKEYVLMILVGELIAFPLAWYILDQWLASFSYRIALNPLLFLAGGVAVILISFIVMGTQSLKAAYSNPVQTLKSE